MLRPAAAYETVLMEKFKQHCYDEDMMYYTGTLGFCEPTIWKNDEYGNCRQYAIVNNENEVIGYFSYNYDHVAKCASHFGLFSFDRGNPTIGIDVLRELNYLIKKCHVHRIEYNMISGNPVENHYDKFCYHYCGKKITLTDVLKDREGNYHNCVIYEIIFNNN